MRTWNFYCYLFIMARLPIIPFKIYEHICLSDHKLFVHSVLWLDKSEHINLVYTNCIYTCIYRYLSPPITYFSFYVLLQRNKTLSFPYMFHLPIRCSSPAKTSLSVLHESLYLEVNLLIPCLAGHKFNHMYYDRLEN